MYAIGRIDVLYSGGSGAPGCAGYSGCYKDIEKELWMEKDKKNGCASRTPIFLFGDGRNVIS